MTTAALHHIEQNAGDASTFWFKPDKPVPYTAGQFVEITLPHKQPDSRGANRWFTLSSSPSERLLSITTRHVPEPSSFKRHLFALKPGDTVHVSDPMGDFVLPRSQSVPLLFVAFGIGITPMRSMLQWLKDGGESRDIIVLHAVPDPADPIFGELVRSQAQKVRYFSPQTDRLDVGIILDTYRSLVNPLIYISGPEEVVEVFVADLKSAGVKGSHLVTDYFHGYGNTALNV